MLERFRPRFTLLSVAIVLTAVTATTWAKDTISDAKVVRWVAKTVAERQAPAEDKRFDEIGWAPDIRTAINLGKESNRPIFLLTVDGRINTGRC